MRVRIDCVWIAHLARDLGRIALPSRHRAMACFSGAISRSLSLCEGVSFRNLAFLAPCARFSNSGSLSATRRFYPLCHRRPGGLFCSAYRPLRRRIGLIRPQPSGCFARLVGCLLRCTGRLLCLGLRQHSLFAHLLRRPVPHLSPVLPPRCRKVAIFSSMQVCPRVENCGIFRRLRQSSFVLPVRATKVHYPQPFSFQRHPRTAQAHRIAASLHAVSAVSRENRR